MNHKNSLNKNLKIFFKDALLITLKTPVQAFSFLRTIVWLRKAAKLRNLWKQQGVHVPPIIIFSITNKCNLSCQGCYNQSFHKSTNNELSDEKLLNITKEAKQLGVSFFVLAGGEPFMRPVIMDIMKAYPTRIKKVHPLYKLGNKKIGFDTIIFNLGTAKHCPSKALGLCPYENDVNALRKGKTVCYACKMEWAKNVLNYRKNQLKHWIASTTQQLIDELKLIIDLYGDQYGIKFFRMNESGDFHKMDEVSSFHSIGLFYNFITWMLGFKPNRHEGKITGLAAYGDPKKTEDIYLKFFNMNGYDFRYDLAKKVFQHAYPHRSNYPKFLDATGGVFDAHSPEDIAAGIQVLSENCIKQYVTYHLAKIRKKMKNDV